jgi:hypothetical protein
MSTYDPMLQDEKFVFEEHKPLNQEHTKNIRTNHLCMNAMGHASQGQWSKE